MYIIPMYFLYYRERVDTEASKETPAEMVAV